MTERQTDAETTMTIPRTVLHNSRRAEREQPSLLRSGQPGPFEESVEVPVPGTLSDEPDEIRVLHVDDNPEYTELTKTFLERQNDTMQVVTATSPVEALDCLQDDDFDCVVSDYEMPTTDGLEFLELLRDRHPDLPFILLTGKGGEAIASEAISAGVTDYVQKKGGTEQYEVLANRVTNAVEQYRTQQRFWDALSWYQRLVKQGLAGVFVVEGDEFAYVNERFAGLFGYDQTELVDASPRRLVDGTDEETLADFIATGTGCEENFQREFSVQRADGAPLSVEIRGGPITYAGRPACIGVVWDSSDSPE